MTLSPSGRSLGDHRTRLHAEINVTPLVDVMLVLLVVFMVTAPMLAAGFSVDLPRAATATELPAEPIAVALFADGRVAVGDEVVTRDALADAVLRRTGGDPTRTVHLRGDRDVPYGVLIAALDDLARHGLTRVALVVERSPAAATVPRP